MRTLSISTNLLWCQPWVCLCYIAIADDQGNQTTPSYVAFRDIYIHTDTNRDIRHKSLKKDRETGKIVDNTRETKKPRSTRQSEVRINI